MGDVLGQGIVRGHAAGKIDHFGLILDITLVTGFGHVFDPVGPFFVVLAENVPAFQEVFLDPVDFFRVGIQGDQVVAQGAPQVLEVNAGRADFLTVGAQGAFEDRIAEQLEVLGRWRFGLEKPGDESGPGFQQFFQVIQAVEPGQLTVRCRGYGRTGLHAQAAPGAGFHFQKLSDVIGWSGHVILYCILQHRP